MTIITKIQAKVIKIIKHTDLVCSFYLKTSRKVPAYKAGQFLHLAMDDYNPSFEWPESRVFSISNFNENSNLLKILISVKGNFTRRMYNDLKIGDFVWIKLPYGFFTFDIPEKNNVFIAGGTGISPFISYLEYGLLHHVNRSIQLYYGVKNKDLIIFEDLLKECKNKFPKFNYHIWCEEINHNLKYSEGKIDVDYIYKRNKSYQPAYFLSGPLDMINDFKKYLMLKDIQEDKIHIDEW